MSRDLSIFHLANRANLTEVRRIGPKTQVLSLKPTDAVDIGGLVFNLVPGLAASMTKASVDGLPLRYYAGSPPPLGFFSILPGSGPGGADQIRIYEPPTADLRVEYTLFDDAPYIGFEVSGTGFRYVTVLTVGNEDVSYFRALSDEKMLMGVTDKLAPSVTLANLKALVELETSPTPTDIVFDISTRARYSTGIRAMTQRFLVLLLYYLDDLLPKSQSVTPQLRSVILNRVGMSVTLAKRRMDASVQSDTPADEILTEAFVNGIRIGADSSVEVSVQLRSASGSTAAVPLTL